MMLSSPTLPSLLLLLLKEGGILNQIWRSSRIFRRVSRQR